MENRFCLTEAIQKTAFFTGHRQLSDTAVRYLAAPLSRAIREAYQQGYRIFVCGGALGFDTLAAQSLLEMKKELPDIVLSLAIPCPSQPDLWPEIDQRIYRGIIRQADVVKVLSPAYYPGVMLSRNRYMVEQSSLCICYLNRMRGGTAYTVRYALQYPYMNFVNLAVNSPRKPDLMREGRWNFTYMSPFAYKNADIVHLSLSHKKKIFLKNTRN